MLISDVLSDWRAVGIVALLAAIYSGAGWMGNLKNADPRPVAAGLRHAGEPRATSSRRPLVNLITLVGLIALIAVTFALASLSTTLADNVIDFLGLSEIGWLGPVLRISSRSSSRSARAG